MSSEDSTILKKLLEIQGELKVEKTRYNSFGNFYARSKEDILEAVKPLAHSRGCVVVCDDESLCLDNGWAYVKTTARLIDVETGEVFDAHGVAREPESKPKMDSSQTTGSASSYAGKRALGNLFALDDTADADNMEKTAGMEPPSGQPFNAACRSCGTVYRFENAEQYGLWLPTAQCCPNPQWEVVS